jgi:hypothetical protein
VIPFVLFVSFVVKKRRNVNNDMQVDRFHHETPQTGSRPNI